MAHCICNSPSLSERLTKQADRENMQWMMMMVNLVWLLRRAGLLTDIQTPITDMYVPEVLAGAATYGLNQVDAPRHLLRLTAAVRAYVVVRAILRVFGSTTSPLAVRDPTTGVYTGQPFSMHAFALLDFHLTDAADPTIVSLAMGMLVEQWEKRARHPVLETMSALLFSCSEEAFDDGELAKKREALLARRGATPADRTLAVTTWLRDGTVHSTCAPRASCGATMTWSKIVHTHRTALSTSLAEGSRSGVIVRLLLAGGREALESLAAVDAISSLSTSELSNPSEQAQVSKRGRSSDPRSDARPTKRSAREQHAVEGKSGSATATGTRDSDNVPAPVPDPVDPLDMDADYDPFGYAGARSLGGTGSVRIPPQRDRKQQDGHANTCCSCCICLACCDARAVAPPAEPAFVAAQTEALINLMTGKSNRGRAKPGRVGAGAASGYRRAGNGVRLSTVDARFSELSPVAPGLVGAGSVVDDGGDTGTGPGEHAASGHTWSAEEKQLWPKANKASQRAAAATGASAGGIDVLLQMGISRMDALQVAYAGRLGSTHIRAVAATKAMRAVELDPALFEDDLDIVPSDSTVVRTTKRARRLRAVHEAQRAMRRARHLEQERYAIFDSQYAGAFVTSPKIFHKEAEQPQCVAELAKRICRKLRGFTPAAVSATLWDLMATRTPVEIDGAIQYMPALRLNVMRQGVTISKAMLINNRTGILMHLMRSMMEHRFTVHSTHLFGEDPDPASPPYLFQTWSPTASKKPPYQRPVEDASRFTTIALEHNASHSDAVRNVVRGLAQEKRVRVLDRPPEVEAYYAFLNTKAVTAEIAREYRLVPEFELMQEEALLLVQDQVFWEKTFRGSVEFNIDTNNMNPSDAFREARAATTSRPADMLEYPPVADNPANDDVVSSDMDDSARCRRWGWSAHAVALDKATALVATGNDFQAWAAENPVDTVDYALCNTRTFTNFIDGKRQDPIII
jgi:hypothetical protein